MNPPCSTNLVSVLKVIPKKTLKKFHAERSLRSELEIQSHVPVVYDFLYLTVSSRIRILCTFTVIFMMLPMFILFWNLLCTGTSSMMLVWRFSISEWQHSTLYSCARRWCTCTNACAFTGLFVPIIYPCSLDSDLKLENMYLNHRGVLKIGDLGWACHSQRDRGEKVVGTINYCAPEMLAEPEYNHKVLARFLILLLLSRSIALALWL